GRSPGGRRAGALVLRSARAGPPRAGARPRRPDDAPLRRGRSAGDVLHRRAGRHPSRRARRGDGPERYPRRDREGALAPVDDPRLESALKDPQLVLELFGIKALRARVRLHLAQRETEAEARERLHGETREAGGTELVDVHARLVEQADATGVVRLERVKAGRHGAAADRRPALRRDGAQAEEVRGAVGLPERVVLDRVGAGTEDAAERFAPRVGRVVCELPRLPQLSAIGHCGAHYQPTALTQASRIVNNSRDSEGGGRTWRLNSS